MNTIDQIREFIEVSRHEAHHRVGFWNQQIDLVNIGGNTGGLAEQYARFSRRVSINETQGSGIEVYTEAFAKYGEPDIF